MIEESAITAADILLIRLSDSVRYDRSNRPLSNINFEGASFITNLVLLISLWSFTIPITLDGSFSRDLNVGEFSSDILSWVLDIENSTVEPMYLVLVKLSLN